MKKSINQWSFAGMDIFDCIELAAAAGFECFEPAFGEEGPLSPKGGRKEAEAVRRAADDAGIEIASLASGFFWTWNLASDDEAVRVKSEELTRSALQCAEWLGTDALLVIPGIVAPGFGTPREIIPYDVCYERALAGMKRLAPHAERHGVVLAVENVWNSFHLSPLEMRDFVDAVGSDCAGVYFDVGNVIPFGYPEQWIRILGPRIRRIHMKDFRKSVGTINGFVDLLCGDVNWPEVMKALGEIGYSGPLTAEMGAYRSDPTGVIWQTSSALDRILGLSSELGLLDGSPTPLPS